MDDQTKQELQHAEEEVSAWAKGHPLGTGLLIGFVLGFIVGVLLV